MLTCARTWTASGLLALTLFAPATAAVGQTPGGCGTPATPANPTPGSPGATPATPAQPAQCPDSPCDVGTTPANPTPGSPGATPATPGNQVNCGPGPDGVLGTADDVVLGVGFDRPERADTGAGGTAGADPRTLVLVGGGVVALGAAFGIRRASRARAA